MKKLMKMCFPSL